MKKNNIGRNKEQRFFVFLVCIIVSFIAFSVVLRCFEIHNGVKELDLSYSYQGDVNYQVTYLQNKFYDNNSSQSDIYVSSLIDKIKVNMKYELSSSKDMDTTLVYDIKARLVNNYNYNNVSSVLWEKEYILLSSRTTKSSYINENITIPYQSYNSLALSFQQQYKLSLNSYLLVEMNVKSSSSFGENSYVDDGKVTLKIPLLQNVVKLEKNVEVAPPKNIYDTLSVDNDFPYVTFILACVILLFSLISATLSLSSFLVIDRISRYNDKKKQIMRRYSDIIAEVTTRPSLKDLEVIDIKHFDDLVDIEEELRSPILFYEVKGKYESVFVIIEDNKAYRYVLKVPRVKVSEKERTK